MDKVTAKILFLVFVIIILLILGYVGGLIGPSKSPTPAQEARIKEKETRILQIKENSSKRRAYSSMVSESEKNLYANIVYALENLNIYVSNVPSNQNMVFNIFESVMTDYPEFFWVKPKVKFVTKMIGRSASSYRLEFSYIDDRNKEIISSKQIEIDLAVKSILEKINDEISSYEKARYVYEYLILNTTYNEKILDQSMYSILVKREGVCASYARAFQYLMNKLGIQASLVSGRIKQDYTISNVRTSYSYFNPLNSSDHAWNIINIDGNWYHVDVTSGKSLSSQNNVSYQFFFLTADTIRKTHSF